MVLKVSTKHVEKLPDDEIFMSALLGNLLEITVANFRLQDFYTKTMTSYLIDYPWFSRLGAKIVQEMSAIDRDKFISEFAKAIFIEDLDKNVKNILIKFVLFSNSKNRFVTIESKGFYQV